MKIAFFDTKPYDKKIFDDMNKSFGYDIKYFETRLLEETVDLTKGYDVVCAFVNDDLGSKTINRMYENGVKFIALRSAGYNNVDLKETYEKINVANVPKYSPYAVAEHTVGLILSMNRKIHKAYYRTKDGNFTINGLMGFDMRGKTIGIIGTGKIGQTLIEILSGFGMRVLAYDKFPNEEAAEKLGYEYVDLTDLLEKSDIISLNCPLTKETYHMINEQTLSFMKPNAMVVNTGRGRLINTKDLIEALKSGKIGSAALDVYEEENEYFFEDFSSEIIEDDMLARLISLPNVLLTSHQAFFTNEAITNIARVTLENIKEYADDKAYTNEVCYRCKKEKCTKNEKGRCF
ncbi:MAG: 2-hydroxyacid dehydrogenase [Clostridia bacterium]|jgi:D-lactate dehydrogenase|nr:2-hydroxyacid dehydrogenase [Clostridia bacterium]